MIVVTGATGHVGRELVAQLARSGAAVRAVTRRPGASAFPAGVEVVKGDFDDRASLTAAFRGAEGAFLMSPRRSAAPRTRPTTWASSRPPSMLVSPGS